MARRKPTCRTESGARAYAATSARHTARSTPPLQICLGRSPMSEPGRAVCAGLNACCEVAAGRCRRPAATKSTGRAGAHADWLRNTAFEGELPTTRSWLGNSGAGVARSRDRRRTTLGRQSSDRLLAETLDRLLQGGAFVGRSGFHHSAANVEGKWQRRALAGAEEPRGGAQSQNWSEKVASISCSATSVHRRNRCIAINACIRALKMLTLIAI